VSFFVNHDWYETVLQRVVTKDIGDFSADDRPYAGVEQRPGSVLAGRSAAKIVAANKDLTFLRLRGIQNEVVLRCAAFVKAKVVEQECTETLT